MEIQRHMKEQRGVIISRIGSENYSKCYTYLRIISAFLNARKIITEQGIEPFQSFITEFSSLTSFNNDKVTEMEKSRDKSFQEEKSKLISSNIFSELTDASRELAETHPKQIKLRILLRDFFSDNPSSKCMVFTHNRASASEIASSLLNSNFAKASVFLGQSNNSNMKMTQKEQLQIISDFKSNVFNVLVATCIGEEGLDIGEVDLIVCYDSGFSPIRMIQRIGRTGRQRKGKVFVLLMEGKEAEAYRQATTKSKRIQETLKIAAGVISKRKGQRGNFSVLRFFGFNPRMIPEDIVPSLVLDDGKEDYDEEELDEIVESKETKKRKSRDNDKFTKKTRNS